ncbi:MAG: KamA family radical SAM protein [Verrucomicrobia bacterium]|nr:MAG: KamA family radical SAM protein [Verrucomicrobiota bacterium]TAE86227.1 MAG: KamA family radical SAM protein [Verrucomicrobiota bacterium]TAF23673.1 MAG: KamA family radical SAM protein [Verrucomicrobiota bacterium]TAF40216.1 MAG: KamA family radical SAM protein [Verrucomicrobiota bacterium]
MGHSNDLEPSFRSHSPGYWPESVMPHWDDATWQLKNRVSTLAALEERLTLTDEERAGVLLAGNKLAMSITPHFFNLIDAQNPDCPIRRQVIPRIEEGWDAPEEMADPCGEDSHMPVPGLVHRYPDRVLFLVTDRCASYCRYCTRSRVVSGVGDQHLETQWEPAFRYLEQHTEIRDVLLSGGDPLLFSDAKLEKILARLRAIPHLQFLRIGSRIPIFLPQRITPELCTMLQKYHPLFISIHTNHPRELTLEVKQGLERLANAGIPLGNQSVILKGVNDSVEVQKALVHKLLMCRVRPYYLYQCDMIRGSSHLRTPVSRGVEIIDGLRGHTTGYAIPQFVIDGPGGGGKIPLNPNYIVHRDPDKTVLRNYEGEIFEYPEPSPIPASELLRLRDQATSSCGAH